MLESMNNSDEGNGKVLRKKKEEPKEEKPKPPVRRVERKDIKKPESGRVLQNKISHDVDYFHSDPTQRDSIQFKTSALLAQDKPVDPAKMSTQDWADLLQH